MTASPTTTFDYVACQHGAEPTIKRIFCEPNGPYRLAYSQKGLVTLKSNFAIPCWSKAVPTHPIVRSRGHILKRYDGEVAETLVDSILEEYRSLDWTDLHVWQRDIAQPGWHGFEPGRSALARYVAEAFEKRLSELEDERATRVNQLALNESQIIEVIIDDPNRWWLATRVVQSVEDGWVGGVYVPHEPNDMISRAYLKIAEAIQWSQMPIRPGDQVVEIGSSPGGACQHLIDLGAKVTGVDPAEMDPRVASHPSFEHWRARSLQVKRKAFAPFRFLVCDANVAPNYTLETIESIVTYPTTRLEGIIMTIKLSSWEQSDHIPEQLDRVRSWGFTQVSARQLGHNRREYCIAAKR
ncbi:SAM-dependent methyltransferase [Pirellulaceae bacterium SH449]